MAIWQYDLMMLPREEIQRYIDFEGVVIDSDFLETIDWWKRKLLKLIDLSKIEEIYSKAESWSDSLLIIGAIDSDCIKISHADGTIDELLVRTDLRRDSNNLFQRL
ncbi:MAG: hypothetical protein IPL46_07465 [Saprospiraceae bacterium]|nr:hypothetical protein [Saprospiraceae bacterium]